MLSSTWSDHDCIIYQIRGMSIGQALAQMEFSEKKAGNYVQTVHEEYRYPLHVEKITTLSLLGSARHTEKSGETPWS